MHRQSHTGYHCDNQELNIRRRFQNGQRPLFAGDKKQTVRPEEIELLLGGEDLRITRELGQGAFGTVYLAYDKNLARKVAVKILHSWTASDNGSDAAHRLRREAKTLASFNNMNLLKVYRFGWTTAGTPFLVSEFLEGKSLRDKIRESGALTINECMAISEQICEGMLYAEQQGVVHRDIKPENIFLCDSNLVKVLDFGLCRAENSIADTAGFRTKTGTLVGTPSYMSPEHCLGKQLDSRSDIYSFGCVLLEMMTGKIQFDGATPHEIFLKQLNKRAPFLQESAPVNGLPQELIELLESCLEKNANSRPKSFADLLERIRKIRTLNCNIRLAERLEQPNRREGNRWVFLVLASTLALLFTVPSVGSFFLLSASGQRILKEQILSNLPSSTKFELLEGIADFMITQGLPNQAKNLILTQDGGTEFIPLKNLQTCIFKTKMLTKLKVQTNSEVRESLSLSLLSDILHSSAYFYLHPVRKDLWHSLYQIPLDGLRDFILKRDHSDLYWNELIKLCSERPVGCPENPINRAPQLLDVQIAALDRKKLRTYADLLEFADASLLVADDNRPPIERTGVMPERNLEVLRQRTEGILSSISSFQSRRTNNTFEDNQQTTIRRLRTHANLYLAEYWALKGNKKQAELYFKSALAMDKNNHELYFSGPDRYLTFETLTGALTRLIFKKQEQ